MTSAMAKIGKLRLITLPQFEPDLQTLQPDSLHEFASRCVSFANHYLQTPDWAENFDSHDRIVWAADDLPPATERFQWLHAATDDLEIVFDCLKRTDSNDTVTIVTAEQGCELNLEDPFSSLLSESTIRVPLWISLPGHPAGCVQMLTGTGDLIATIERFTRDSSSVDGVLNLLEAASSPGALSDRQLRIRSVRAEAIRTDAFLFARSLVEDEFTGERPAALYSKPDDLWNLHDVSGEYPETAEQLAAALVQTEA